MCGSSNGSTQSLPLSKAYKRASAAGSIFAGYERCLLHPAFRRVTAARDLTGLVEPLALHLDPGGVFLSLRRHLHRIAHLFLPVFGKNDLRSGRVAVHDDEWIVDRHVESGSLAWSRSGGSR